MITVAYGYTIKKIKSMKAEKIDYLIREIRKTGEKGPITIRVNGYVSMVDEL